MWEDSSLILQMSDAPKIMLTLSNFNLLSSYVPRYVQNAH